MEGKSLTNLYQKRDLLGEGSAQLVFVAQGRPGSQMDGELVVIKVYKGGSTFQEYGPRFQLWAALRSPNLVRALDFGLWQGDPAVVFEFVKGVTLSELIVSQVLSSDEVTEVVTQVEQGLGALVSWGLHHGDLSLHNIMVDGEGRVVLIDYDSHYGSTVDFSATPHFIAPEIWLGAESSYRSDLFSLGVIEKFLTGEINFTILVSLEDIKRECVAWVDPNSHWLHPEPKKRRFMHLASNLSAQKTLGSRSRNVRQKKVLAVTTRPLGRASSPLIQQHSLRRRVGFLIWFLLLVFVQSVNNDEGMPEVGIISFRTRNWVRITIEDVSIGYSPLSLPLRAGRYTIEWTTHNGQGSKVLTVNGGEHTVLKDSYFFDKGIF